VVDPDSLQRLSRRLLNGDHRLRAAAVIAAMPKAGFKTGELALQLQPLSEKDVSELIRFFRDSSLLERVAHGVWKRRHERWWQGCADLANEATSSSPRTLPGRQRLRSVEGDST
jgi:hypothetical protein